MTISRPPRVKTQRYDHIKRSLLIGAAACAFAAMPLLPAAAMPRAAAHAVIGSDNAVVLTHGDHGHALGHTVRIERSRDDAWSRGLRRFRSSFN
jgi:hypothetical protein